MQTRFVDQRMTIFASDILTINSSLFNPAVVRGGALSLSGERLAIAPSTVLLPNGVVVVETESRDMVFNNTGWKTIFYKYTENQILGGIEVELTCKAGIYSQEELIETDDGNNAYSTVIGWINATASGYELIRPNADLYKQYLMNIKDAEHNKLFARDLFSYLVDLNPTLNPITQYNSSLGQVDIDPTGIGTVLQSLIQTLDVTITIPFSFDALGTFIIERKANAGAEMRLKFLSLDGSTNMTGSSLTGKLECKDNATTTWTQGTTSILKTTGDETDFTKLIIRPSQKFLDNLETEHPTPPRFGVLKITIPTPANGAGSDGAQYIRSGGFSSLNTPQIIN